MAIPTLEDCKPGYEAVGFKLILAMEEITDKIGSIFIPDSAKDKERMVQVRGRIVSQGSVAWDFARFPEGTEPKVGDVVMCGKLAGFMFDGTDKKSYRVIHDQDVSALVSENAA